MKRETRKQMFDRCKEYVESQQNPKYLLENGSLFFYMAGRFPKAKIEDCCWIMQALRNIYYSL